MKNYHVLQKNSFQHLQKWEESCKAFSTKIVVMGLPMMTTTMHPNLFLSLQLDVSSYILCSNSIKGAKWHKGKSHFKGLHLTCGIHVLVLHPIFSFLISSLQLCVRYEFIFITSWSYIMYFCIHDYCYMKMNNLNIHPQIS